MRSSPDRASFGYPLLRMPFHSRHDGISEHSSKPSSSLRGSPTPASRNLAESAIGFGEWLKQVCQTAGFGQGLSGAQDRDLSRVFILAGISGNP